MKNTDFGPLEFTLLDGSVTPVPENHSTPWRNLPFHVLVCQENLCGHIQYAGTDYDIPHNCAYLVRRDVPHKLTSLEGVNPLSIWCHFRIEFHGGIDFLNFFEIPPYFERTNADAIRTLCRELVSECEPSPVSESIRRQRLGFLMLSKIVSVCTERRNACESFEAVRRISPALEYFRRHLSDGYDARKAAASVSLSQSRFAAVFQKITGLSPSRFFRNLRLARGYEMLRAGESTIKEIADALGFCDEFHFAKTFQTRYGITPSALRRKFQNGEFL